MHTPYMGAAADRCRRLLITGTGRSGTAYVCRLLQGLGIDASHEDLYKPRTTRPPEWPDGRRAEVSWMAAPFLSDLPQGTLVLHQTRNPLEVARSFLGRVLFHHGDRTPYSDFLRRHEPDVFRPRRVPVRFMRYYVAWNLRIEEYADFRHRLEDLNDPAYLRRVLELVGASRSEQEIKDVLQSISLKTNAGPREEEHTWASLPAGRDRDKFVSMAARYGYSTVD